MTTSGTVGLTTINVQKLIDHGARRCGVLAEQLTSEQQLSARESLYYLLSNLGNRGIQYWAIDKQIIGLIPNKAVYDLPLGAIDALNVFYRTANRPDGSYSSTSGTASLAFDGDVDTSVALANGGNIAVNYGENVFIGTLGILSGTTGTVEVVFEYSSDGSSWETLYAPGEALWTDKQWVWYDLNAAQEVQYYRVRVVSGAPTIREFYLGNNTREIEMSRLNRDDYTNLPNKNFTANQPFQFWFDRTIPKPSMYLWPVPSDTFVQVIVWYQRQIQDVGTLQDELEIPQRWILAIQSMLAHQMSMELPQIPMDRITMLKSQADEYLYQAEQEERDNSPIYLAPNISVYTR